VNFRQTSVVIEAQACAYAEVRTELNLVLQIPARLFRAVVAVGIALQEVRADESVSRIGDG
jgi:hypothetical protein